MYTRGNNMETVAERLVDAILSDNYLSREKLIPRCKAILSAWIQSNDKPKNYNKITTEKGKLVKTIEQKNTEMKYWMQKVRELKNKDEMSDLYSELNSKLQSEGYL